MHLLIPFASGVSPAAAHTLGTLQLPHLSKLLSRLQAGAKTGGDEYSFSTPHEVALARVWAWPAVDGELPWAALQASADGVDVREGAWGLLTPAHWQVGRDHITMADPDALALSADESRALLQALQPLFADDGWTLHWGAAQRWYASHPCLNGLRCASLDRVIGRNVDLWLPNTAQVQAIRRLQSEAQMLLYAHPLHDDRQERGELPVNSFWLSGCGTHRPAVNTRALKADELQVDNRLRAPLLAEDWASWAEAWTELDASVMANLLQRSQRGEAVSLTLCGERHSQCFSSAPQSLWRRVSSTWNNPAVAPVLEAL
ncbi:MAG: hypothetical protein H7143_04100 [Pseudorhodobacter sp.]|nr:hypothetical protein [Rhizobacter sp.]